MQRIVLTCYIFGPKRLAAYSRPDSFVDDDDIRNRFGILPKIWKIVGAWLKRDNYPFLADERGEIQRYIADVGSDIDYSIAIRYQSAEERHRLLFALTTVKPITLVAKRV
jgi:hypothetical protein